MGINHLLFYSCLRLRFPDVETNQRRPAPTFCRILCSNVRGLSKNLSNLTVALSQFDIMLYSKTMVSDMRHVSELQVTGFGRPVMLCRDRIYLEPVEWQHMCEMDL